MIAPSRTTTGPAVLRGMLARHMPVEVTGANDALSARLGEEAGFDALWASGLAISTASGYADTSLLTMSEFLHAAANMREGSQLPVIADCDTGFGGAANLVRTVLAYESAGIAAVCFEDKQFPKRNSFMDGQELADPYVFAATLGEAKAAQRTKDFIVVARLESFIAGTGLDDALMRAQLYADAGADAILVHSKKTTAEEVTGFAAIWQETSKVPLVAVPTTYHTSTTAQLHDAGFQVIIYANHAMRAAVTAMKDVLARIKRDGTTTHVEAELATVKELFRLGGTDVAEGIERRVQAAARQMQQAL